MSLAKTKLEDNQKVIAGLRKELENLNNAISDKEKTEHEAQSTVLQTARETHQNNVLQAIRDKSAKTIKEQCEALRKKLANDYSARQEKDESLAAKQFEDKLKALNDEYDTKIAQTTKQTATAVQEEAKQRELLEVLHDTHHQQMETMRETIAANEEAAMEQADTDARKNVTMYLSRATEEVGSKMRSKFIHFLIVFLFLDCK